MNIPLQITFRNVAATPAIEQKIRVSAERLERFCRSIMSCRVMVEAPARHRKRGYGLHVRIDLTLPDGEIVVRREPTLYEREQGFAGTGSHKRFEIRPERRHLEVAIREAFHAARRQLQDYARRVRMDVKAHEPMAEGRVSKLFPVRGYGYIETQDGREIYFHANSVLKEKFAALEPGSKVTFTEEAGEKGPQGSTVRLVTRARSKPAPLPVVSRPRRKGTTA
jgi:cold shock CspA family protein